MNPKYTHFAREHRTADAWVEPLLTYIKSDAFNLSTTARHMGRVLDAVEHILNARGWPPTAVAGVAAYIVTA